MNIAPGIYLRVDYMKGLSRLNVYLITTDVYNNWNHSGGKLAGKNDVSQGPANSTGTLSSQKVKKTVEELTYLSIDIG